MDKAFEVFSLTTQDSLNQHTEKLLKTLSLPAGVEQVQRINDVTSALLQTIGVVQAHTDAIRDLAESVEMNRLKVI